MEIKIFQSHPLAQLPRQAYENDAGLDVSIVDVHSRPSESVTVYRTGLYVVIPPGYVLKMYGRSSLWKMGYMLANNVGIIDADYRGEILVALYKIPSKDSATTGELSFPTRVCQLIAQKVEPMSIVPSGDWEVEKHKYNNTARADGGFGSSGK